MRMYALYEADGLYALEESVWQPISLFPKDSTTYYWDITLAGNDTLWLSTNLGPVFLDDSSKKLLRSNGEMLPLDDSHRHKLSPNTWNIYSIHHDKTGNLWLVDISKADPTFVFIPHWKKDP